MLDILPKHGHWPLKWPQAFPASFPIYMITFRGFSMPALLLHKIPAPETHFGDA